VRGRRGGSFISGVNWTDPILADWARHSAGFRPIRNAADERSMVPNLSARLISLDTASRAPTSLGSDATP
jgi:hypothetical protein